MNHRKSVEITESNDIKTRSAFLIWDKKRMGPAYCLFGVRHRDDMNLTWARVWNYGNLSLSWQGKRVKQRTCKLESTNGQHRGRVTRSSVEVFVMNMKRRGYVIQFSEWANSTSLRMSL